MNTQPLPNAPQLLQNAATTGNGGTLMLRGLVEQLTVFVYSTGTTSGGTISVEEAFWEDDDPQFAGTWSVIQLLNASDITGGASVMIHKSCNSWAVRVRIATTITGGGSISAVGWGS